jgi:hypothetical protein
MNASEECAAVPDESGDVHEKDEIDETVSGIFLSQKRFYRTAISQLLAAILHIRDDRRCGLEPYPETYERAIATAEAALKDEDGREQDIRNR